MQGTQHDQAAPVDQFYLFDQDHLKFITPAQSRWSGQVVNAADIVNLAENSEDQEKIDFVNQRTVPQDGTMQLRFECIPSLLRNATFHRSQVYIDGKTLLSGAAGKRARSQFSLKNKESRNELAAALSCNSTTNLSASPEWVSEPAPSVPICLDCRNLTNYYHFISETLAALSVVAPLARGRRINIHTGNTKTAKDGFAYRFLLAAFPKLADQIYFINDLNPVSYEDCIYPFSTDHMFYILNRDAWSEAETRSVSEDLRDMCEATDKERNIFRFLSFDGSLARLRENFFP